MTNADTRNRLFEELTNNEFDRSSYILAIGGGIVCDISGFAASCFMRGIDFGFISTTLLSQVDASVGGKNGINFKGYKNMIGNFNLPQFVICDPEMLKSLKKEDLLCGMGEVVKHGIIADKSLFEFIEKNAALALQSDPKVLERFVYDSVVIKSGIVNKDAREKGERRKLNFGHTFGHAIEKVKQIPHGMAISIGMVVAAELSVSRNLLSRAEADRIKNVLKSLQLPTQIDIKAEEALNALKRDKKRDGDSIHFVLLKSIGEAVIEEITIKELEKIAYEVCVYPG
ncbi:MAG: 3-dehydroquinate synthase [Bacteroidales bacterium]|nr:3-dehydroquinate synthase [Bacteroidales bacterium]